MYDAVCRDPPRHAFPYIKVPIGVYTDSYKYPAPFYLSAMSDLVCERCGTATTFADALVADRRRSCDGRKHEWVRPMNNSVDIVIG